jgi:hypothetical protein
MMAPTSERWDFTAYNTGVNQFIYDLQGAVQYATGSAPARSIGDILELTFERRDTTLLFTVRNQTTNSSPVTLTYNYPSSQSVPVPNVGVWGLMLSGTAGSVELQYLKIESDEWQYPALFLLGNSKLAVGYGDDWSKRVGEKLNTNFPHTVFSAGSAERLSDMWFKLKEIQRFDAQQFICYDCHSNSTRAGVSTAAVVDTLQRMWEMITNGGGSFKFIAAPEDSTVNGANGLTAVKNWIVANHSADYIDVWTTLGGGTNKLLLTYAHSGADKVHLNQAGQDVIYNAIVASTQITTIASNRRAPYRVFSPELMAIGDSLTFLHPIIPRQNTLARFTNDLKIAPSSIYDNLKNIVISQDNTTTPYRATHLVTIKGAVGLTGINAQLDLSDRTTPANSHYKYSDADILRFGFNTGGSSPVDYTSVDKTGKWRISPTNSGTYKSSFTIQQPYSFNYGSKLDGMQFTIDSATVTYTASSGLPLTSTFSVNPTTWNASGAASYPWAASIHARGPAIAGTNTTFTNGALSFWAETGNSFFNGNVLLGSSAYLNFGGSTFGSGSYGVRDNAGTMEYKNSGGSWAAFSSGGGITGTLTSGRIPYATGTSTVADNSNFLWNNTGQMLSIGTTTAVGHLNVGGNVTWSGSQAGLQAYFVGATYNDNTTAASGQQPALAILF